jgi:HEPN domain-containing protein
LEKIPEKLKYINYGRVFHLACFWAKFYEIAKYGDTRLGVSMNNLFTKEDANLVIKHAEECFNALKYLKTELMK